MAKIFITTPDDVRYQDKISSDGNKYRMRQVEHFTSFTDNLALGYLESSLEGMCHWSLF